MRKRTAAASGSQVPMIDVASVKPMGGFTLLVAFSDGSSGVHDFSPTTARDGEMVRPLKGPAFFARVFVELGALAWPNGFDLDPIALHDRMSAAGELGREVAEQHGRLRHLKLSEVRGVGAKPKLRPVRASNADAQANCLHVRRLSSRALHGHPRPLTRARESIDLSVWRPKQVWPAASRRVALSLVI